MIKSNSILETPTLVSERLTVYSPELLQIRDNLSISYGAHQIWYRNWMGRMGGCGPTAAANLLWYLTASRPETCNNLFNGDGTKRADMLRLMEVAWNYVTPGFGGVNKASILTDGIIRYGLECGVSLNSKILEVPSNRLARPQAEKIYNFLAMAFSSDLPVAFLNLSNGELRNLESWHWVTLISTDNKLQVEMYDQGGRQLIDIDLWLKTTKSGGAFAMVQPNYENHLSRDIS